MRASIYMLVFLSFIAASITWLSGCKRCNDIPSYTEDKFKSLYPWYMGFEGHETLTFLKNGKDTVYFNGQGLQVYNENERLSNGDCEADFILLNHKIIFNNKSEGDLVFHYFKEGKEGYDTYEIIFQNKALIKPIGVTELSITPYDSVITVLGQTYNESKRYSPNKKDSLYLNGSDDPRYRIVRIKLNNIIYEVIP